MSCILFLFLFDHIAYLLFLPKFLVVDQFYKYNFSLFLVLPYMLSNFATKYMYFFYFATLLPVPLDPGRQLDSSYLAKCMTSV